MPLTVWSGNLFFGTGSEMFCHLISKYVEWCYRASAYIFTMDGEFLCWSKTGVQLADSLGPLLVGSPIASRYTENEFPAWYL